MNGLKKDFFCVSCEDVLDCEGSLNGGENCIRYKKRTPVDTRSTFLKVCDAIHEENERRKNGRT